MATLTSARQIAVARSGHAPWDFGEGRGFFPLEQNSEPVTPRMLFGPGLWMRYWQTLNVKGRAIPKRELCILGKIFSEDIDGDGTPTAKWVF